MIPKMVVKLGANFLTKSALRMYEEGLGSAWSYACNSVASSTKNQTKLKLTNHLKKVIEEESNYVVQFDRYEVPLVAAPIQMEVSMQNRSMKQRIGDWNMMDGFAMESNYSRTQHKPFYRVGNELPFHKKSLPHLLHPRGRTWLSMGMDYKFK